MHSVLEEKLTPSLPVETLEPSLRIVVALHSVLWDHADGGDERRNRSGYIADPVAPSEAKALRRDPVEDELKMFLSLFSHGSG